MRDQCWYDLLGKGLQASGLQEDLIETPDGPIKRYQRPEDATPAADAVVATPAPAGQELPQWLREAVAGRASNDQFVRPSDAAGHAGQLRSGESIAERGRALQRGTLVHRLLQSLPDLAVERRREAAQKFLARNAPAWDDGERQRLAESVLALIADGRFAAVFAEGSRAEVAIVGRLDLPRRGAVLVSGQIDRLVVTENEVLIVDFKTNHAPPASAADAPAAYVRQLALYQAALRKLYPQHSIRAALLWTETTDLMEISAQALDAELTSGAAGTARA